MAKNTFVIPDYDRPHNMERKLVVLNESILTLEAFQDCFGPIFDDDPMVNGHLERLRADMAEVENRLQAIRRSNKPYNWHSGAAPQDGICVQCARQIQTGSPMATLEAYGQEYWFCRHCAEAMLEE